MADYRSYKKLDCWQTAKEMTLLVYRTFVSLKDFSFRDQVQSASVSTMSNIAEGYSRFSQKEFVRFLQIALASNTEVSSLLDLSKDIGYINSESFQKIDEMNIKLSKQLTSFINSIQTQIEKGVE
jgi:four helix bundle protein